MLHRFCWLLLLITSLPAQAIPISVSFSGVTSGTNNVAGMPQLGNFDGLGVIGAFAFDTVQGSRNGFLSFIIPDRPNLSMSTGLSVWFSRGFSGDSIFLNDPPLFIGRPPFTRVVLSAPSGSLPLLSDPQGQILGLDAAAFDSRLIDSIDIFFNLRPGPSGSIRVDQVSFSGSGTAVPVPSTSTLLLLGLAVCFLGARTQRRVPAMSAGSARA